MGYTGTTRTGNAGTPSTTTGFYDLTSSYATIFEGTNIGSTWHSCTRNQNTRLTSRNSNRLKKTPGLTTVI